MIDTHKIDQHALKFAWVPVPPALSKELYRGEASWHERRKAAHTSSLLALGLLVNNIGETEVTSRFLRYFAADSSKKQLQERDYHCLTQDQWTCSRSHTDRWACALIGPQRPQEFSVGVDVEPSQRAVNPEIKRFYVHPDDATEDLQPLEIWCLKEAVFKAVSSFLAFQQQTPSSALVLTDLQLMAKSVQEVSFSYRHYRGCCGILPSNHGPEDLCTAWALLSV